VEIVSFVTGQWRHHVAVLERLETNDALLMLLELAPVEDARHLAQSFSRGSAIIGIRLLLLPGDLIPAKTEGTLTCCADQEHCAKDNNRYCHEAPIVFNDTQEHSNYHI